ncbi:MAG TPA: YjzC family protein [Acidimicrobiia bacterium]|nr:YjzC family protein [Acidimicrobiia bacterium]
MPPKTEPHIRSWIVRSRGRTERNRNMPSTGQKCQQSGIYQSGCTDKTQIALSKGDTFPPCRNHGSVNWALIKATVN